MFSYDQLKTAYLKAKAKREECFTFHGRKILTKFAEYYLIFIKEQIGKKGIGEFEEVLAFQDHTEKHNFNLN